MTSWRDIRHLTGHPIQTAVKTTASSSLLALLFCIPTAAQEPQPAVTRGMPGVVAAGTKIQLIKDGFQGTEGPVSLPDGGIIFDEYMAGRVVRVMPDGSISTFIEKTDGSNALAFDASGRLLSVQTAPGHVEIAVIYPKGKETVVADTSSFGRANDLVVAKNGSVFFTISGPNARAGGPPPAVPPAVYYVPPGGKATKIIEDISRPNGIVLSADEKILYISNSNGEYTRAYDVQPDGTVRNGRNFARFQGMTEADHGISGADGMTIDSDHRVYVATPQGVQVFTGDGEPLGTIPVPKGPTQNLAFAGADKNILYVASRGAIFKIQMLAHGLPDRAK
jgi:gluconolactonase